MGSTLAGLFDLMGIAEDEVSAAMVRHRVYACLLHATMSCFRVDDSAPAIVARAAAPHTRPASIRPASPALPRYCLTDSRESLIDTALLWREFALSLRARFDVEQKALDAIVFTVTAGGTSLATPPNSSVFILSFARVSRFVFHQAFQVGGIGEGTGQVARKRVCQAVLGHPDGFGHVS